MPYIVNEYASAQEMHEDIQAMYSDGYTVDVEHVVVQPCDGFFLSGDDVTGDQSHGVIVAVMMVEKDYHGACPHDVIWCKGPESPRNMTKCKDCGSDDPPQTVVTL